MSDLTQDHRTPSSVQDGEARDNPARRLGLLWRQGQEPKVEQFLAEAGICEVAEILAVLQVDQSERLRIGRRVPAEAYLQAFPALANDPQHAIDLVFAEYLLREDLGERPTLDEMVERFPQYAAELRLQIGLHHAMETRDGQPTCASGESRSTLPLDQRSDPAEELAGLPVVPGYEIVGVLGRGGMGIVYRAYRTELNRQVAIKMVHAGAQASARTLARFRVEAEAVARLQHPNIVQVHDVGQHAGSPFLVLELVEGQNLAQRISGTPQPARWAAEIVEKIARAVHAAHHQGVVHRDLTPSNILLTDDGTPKIADFGLAKLVIGGGERRTQTGEIVGTPSYMAPEQASGRLGEIGAATDVYALGAILYELITGRPPFKGESPLETMRQVVNDQPVAPSRLRSKLPRDLEVIALKCLHKEPQRRYLQALDLAEDLHRFLEGRPILARRASIVERSWRWCRRNPGLAAASITAAAALASLFVGTAVAAWTFRTQRNQIRQAEAEAKAVIDFLQNDVLAQASSYEQVRMHPEITPDPNLTVRKLLNRAAESIEGKFQSQPSVDATVRETIGKAYLGVESFDKAEHHLKRAVDLWRREQGEKSAETLSAMAQLFWCYQMQMKYREAEAVGKKTLELCLEVLGETHPITLDVMHKLVFLYVDHHKHAQAAPLAQKYMDTCRRVFGESHIQTAQAYAIMGRLSMNQGGYADAEKALTKSYEIRSRILGKEHPSTLGVMTHLAFVNSLQGNNPRAEQLDSELLKTYRRIFSADHPQTLNIVIALGRVYLDEGKLAQAEQLLVQAAQGWSRITNEDHLHTILAKRVLGWIYEAQERYAEAEKLYTDSLERLRRTQGAEHFHTLDALVDLGRLYGEQGRYADGEKLLTQALAEKRRLLGDNDFTTMRAFKDLMRLYQVQGKHALARGLFTDALERDQRTLGEKHPQTIAAMNELAWYLATAPESSGQRDPVRAVELSQKTVAASPQDGNLWNTLGVAYCRVGEWTAAIEALDKSMELSKGGTSLDWFFLAIAESRLGHPAEARNWYNKAVEAMEKGNRRDPELLQFRAEAETVLGHSPAK
jgi:serine/threonine-protein kinase